MVSPPPKAGACVLGYVTKISSRWIYTLSKSILAWIVVESLLYIVPINIFVLSNPDPLIIPVFVPALPLEVPPFVTAPTPAKVSKELSTPNSSVWLKLIFENINNETTTQDDNIFFLMALFF